MITVADSPDCQEGRGRVSAEREVQTGYFAIVVLEADLIRLRERLTAENRYGDRHVLQALFTLLSGDDNFLESHWLCSRRRRFGGRAE